VYGCPGNVEIAADIKRDRAKYRYRSGHGADCNDYQDIANGIDVDSPLAVFGRITFLFRCRFKCTVPEYICRKSGGEGAQLWARVTLAIAGGVERGTVIVASTAADTPMPALPRR
jgi:hypothetical protein